MVERVPVKDKVAGSNPASGALEKLRREATIVFVMRGGGFEPHRRGREDWVSSRVGKQRSARNRWFLGSDEALPRSEGF